MLIGAVGNITFLGFPRRLQVREMEMDAQIKDFDLFYNTCLVYGNGRRRRFGPLRVSMPHHARCALDPAVVLFQWCA